MIRQARAGKNDGFDGFICGVNICVKKPWNQRATEEEKRRNYPEKITAPAPENNPSVVLPPSFCL
jgi:hypothetical protein